VSCGHQIVRIPLGELTTLLRPSSGLGRGIPPSLPIPYSTRRLQCVDSRLLRSPLGALILPPESRGKGRGKRAPKYFLIEPPLTAGRKYTASISRQFNVGVAAYLYCCHGNKHREVVRNTGWPKTQIVHQLLQEWGSDKQSLQQYAQVGRRKTDTVSPHVTFPALLEGPLGLWTPKYHTVSTKSIHQFWFVCLVFNGTFSTTRLYRAIGE